MRIPILFTGIFATFAFAWYGQTLLPKAQLGGLQPQTDEDGSDIYPVNNSGIAAHGRKVYVSEGCFYCHTQLVRDEDAGSDIDRGWAGPVLGKGRRTVARDYIFDNQSVLGLTRNGPDLANEGTRQIDGKPVTAAWLYAHLYNPRVEAPDSIMPSYRYLFQKRKIVSERSADALDLKDADAAPDGYEIVPSLEAKALVAYLLSLDRTHPLKEVKQEVPAK
jgi:cytochrome c oxidase cbb3-type subunit 2